MGSFNDDIDKCKAALASIVDSIEEAGTAIAECNARHNGFLRALHKSTGVSMTLLKRLERVGKGTLDPRVALGIEHGILIERLPIKDQVRIIDEGVDVTLDINGNVMKMRAEEMDQQTAARVMREGIISSVERQMSELRSQEDSARRAAIQNDVAKQRDMKRRQKIISSMPCVFDKQRHAVTITKPIRLTLAQLHLIIEEIG